MASPKFGFEEILDWSGPCAYVITRSSLSIEAQELTMPVSAFSRSTESPNQDKMSMGTIPVRAWLRVLELSETFA
jgi:histidine ammonia-lyase